jgi:hypothetical protein
VIIINPIKHGFTIKSRAKYEPLFIHVFTAVSRATHIKIQKKLLTVSFFMSYLTPLLHNMFHPTWPSSGALKLEELLHFYTLP